MSQVTAQIFTVVPAVDRYNGQKLNGKDGNQLFRIDGYCRHLEAGACHTLYVNESDAQRWVDFHIANFH